MPVLMLGDFADHFAAYEARCRVGATMAWPHDPSRRAAYLASIMAMNAERTPFPSEQHRFLRLMGGIKALAAMASSGPLEVLDAEAVRLVDRACIAGAFLALHRRIAMHHPHVKAGVRRLAYVIEEVRLPGSPKNREDIIKTWSAFRDVAHLGAAMVEAYDYADHSPFSLEGDFEAFLADAWAYQEFGLSSGLLHSDTLWRVPAQSREARSPLPLGDNWLAPLSRYRSAM